MLHVIEQRPRGMGRHLNVEAGCRGDRSVEGSRPFVDQPQLVMERESLVHLAVLSLRSEDRTAIFAADAAAAPALLRALG